MTGDLIRDRATIRNSDEPDRDSRYWAAITRDRQMGAVDAVTRLADAEQADLVSRITGATDDELARRLEWATGRNGASLLAQIRAEGLDVITVTKEQP